MKKIITDKGVLAALAGMLPIVIATALVSGYAPVLTIIWIAWAAAFVTAVALAVRHA
ncbi:hypothetical protein [Hoyosella altamirensis]|uniref:Di/tricarboxylate transporter n=1 Tax=Hoyosella altamirensis TaxID=616997 RepID=A0A839RVW3_9ACTN|nr:hypothetical protein [Hoyosella altamirensis]MBB3040164.1 di/tricarboxylate transporter [Hoyosella altamirensis]